MAIHTCEGENKHLYLQSRGDGALHTCHTNSASTHKLLLQALTIIPTPPNAACWSHI